MNMSSEELEFNKKCAEFLGWTYISWQEGEKRNIPPGWYKKIPKVFHHKLKHQYYVGRSTKDLDFHWNWNSIMDVCKHIYEINDESTLTSSKILLDIRLTLAYALKEETISHINKFIEWHNEKF